MLPYMPHVVLRGVKKGANSVRTNRRLRRRGKIARARTILCSSLALNEERFIELPLVIV